MTDTSMHLWAVGWGLFVLTASILTLEAWRSRRSEGLAHRAYRQGVVWVPCGAVLGLIFGALGCMNDEAPVWALAGGVFTGSVAGTMGAVAHCLSGLILGGPSPRPTRRGKAGDRPPPPTKPEGGDSEI